MRHAPHARGALALALVLSWLVLACSSRHRLGRIESDDTTGSPGAEPTAKNDTSSGGSAGAAGADHHSGAPDDAIGEFVAE